MKQLQAKLLCTVLHTLETNRWVGLKTIIFSIPLIALQHNCFSQSIWNTILTHDWDSVSAEKLIIGYKWEGSEWKCKGQLNSDLCTFPNMATICCELTVNPGWSLPQHPSAGAWYWLTDISWNLSLQFPSHFSAPPVNYLSRFIALIQKQKHILFYPLSKTTLFWNVAQLLSSDSWN